MMIFSFIYRNVPLSFKKTKRIVNFIKVLTVKQLFFCLQYDRRKGISFLKDMLFRFLTKQYSIIEMVFIKNIYVVKGKIFKKVSQKAKGRSTLLKKRTSHLFIDFLVNGK